ncbi:glycosyltransferase [Acidisoma sp. 7E03]
MPPHAKPALLVEGWRGINHSYALVNQYQLREWLAADTFDLFARDLPFLHPDWSRARNGADFPSTDQALIDAIPPPGDRPIDYVYRIGAPIHAGAPEDDRCTITFMVAELGLPLHNFAPSPERFAFFCRDDNRIVTPSRWSRDRIVEFGFPEEKVSVVPHGADRDLFSPLTAEERRARRSLLGLALDETVFVNVGGAFWNKGLDLLLTAFCRLKQSRPRIRLLLKDQRDLYGRTAETVVKELTDSGACAFDAATLAAISIIPGHLTRPQLRDLYGMADAYVSPYRAEGFNLPVLEAIACGTPVIVTAGGATEEFCPEGLALRVPGRQATLADFESRAPGRYIEPDGEALLEAMRRICDGAAPRPQEMASLRETVLTRFSWAAAADQIAALFEGVGQDAARPAAAPAILTQGDVLGFVQRLRPWQMTGMAKTRIGNDYDGGYVLPQIAAEADVVLSIGVGHDVSFDLAMAERGAIILQFDHTVERPPTAHANFRFHKKGLGAQSSDDLLSFAEILSLLAREQPRRPLLKFDIEGAEYATFARIDPALLADFPVIACEIHDLDRLGETAFLRRATALLDVLSASHAPVHLHANNYGRFAVVQGVPVPTVLELSFLRRDLDALPGLARDPLPGPLDRPNHPYLPDLCLTPFG